MYAHTYIYNMLYKKLQLIGIVTFYCLRFSFFYYFLQIHRTAGARRNNNNTHNKQCRLVYLR